MNHQEIHTRVGHRGAGLRRLRRLTGTAAAVTVALAGAFTAMAARSFAGHKHVQTVVPPSTTRAVRKPATANAPPPPALPADASSAQTVTPLVPAPAPAPAPVQQQPAVVSGGS
jgi:hypothetical protein